MSELTKLGVSVHRVLQTSSSEIQGIQVSEKQTTKLVLTLPRDPGVVASFTPESLGKKLAKLFKKEIQVGDKAFDDAIYISTDTPEPTKALLASERIRAMIMLNVMTGGPIEIHGATVTVIVPGHTDIEDPDVVELARAVLALAAPSQPTS